MNFKILLPILIGLQVILFSGCDQTEETPAVTETFTLNLKATIPTSGSTTFTSINYKKADGTLTTLTNTTTSFSESFTISKDHNIFLSVSGTNTSTTQPKLSISYTVEKFENNVSKGIICSGSSVTVSGSPGSWTFNASNNSTFNGSSCQ